MRIFNIFIVIAYCHLLSAFTITAPKDVYVVESGSNVTLECKFPVQNSLDLHALVVYWEKDNMQVIQFVYGEEDPKFQHSSFKNRAWLLKDQLFKGSAVLQITDVKLQDAGVYRCMISYGGADYKRITLKVNAPYRNINSSIFKDPDTYEHELMCQAEGYPEADVIWTSSNHQILNGTTIVTSSQREEKAFNVTSMLRVNATANDIFYCTFWRLSPSKNYTAELIIPEPPAVFLPTKRTYFSMLGALLFVIIAAPMVLFCLRKTDTQFEET